MRVSLILIVLMGLLVTPIAAWAQTNEIEVLRSSLRAESKAKLAEGLELAEEQAEIDQAKKDAKNAPTPFKNLGEQSIGVAMASKNHTRDPDPPSNEVLFHQ